MVVLGVVRSFSCSISTTESCPCRITTLFSAIGKTNCTLCDAIAGLAIGFVNEGMFAECS